VLTEAIDFHVAESHVYGWPKTRVEQINSGGTVTYFHHDQAVSTRLLTGATPMAPNLRRYVDHPVWLRRLIHQHRHWAHLYAWAKLRSEHRRSFSPLIRLRN
jgi:hypothetical protein